MKYVHFFIMYLKFFVIIQIHILKTKKISLELLELLETILNCLVYEYAFCGFHIDEGKDFLILRKCVLRDEDLDDEILNIPVPITRTDDWYNLLKQINSSRL